MTNRLKKSLLENSIFQRGAAFAAIGGLAASLSGCLPSGEAQANENQKSPVATASPSVEVTTTPKASPLETGPTETEVLAMRTHSGGLPAVTVRLMDSRIPDTSKSLFHALGPASAEEFSAQSIPAKIDYVNNLVLDVQARGLYGTFFEQVTNEGKPLDASNPFAMPLTKDANPARIINQMNYMEQLSGAVSATPDAPEASLGSTPKDIEESKKALSGYAYPGTRLFEVLSELAERETTTAKLDAANIQSLRATDLEGYHSYTLPDGSSIDVRTILQEGMDAKYKVAVAFIESPTLSAATGVAGAGNFVMVESSKAEVVVK